MEFKRIKSIERKFYRVRVSEGDLARLAKKIENATNSEGKQIVIRIETADGKEIFTCHDPDFFRSDEMPGEIRSVSIKYNHYDEPIDCSLSFVTGTSGSVKLSVEGGAPEVPGLFEDLEKALKEKRVFGHTLVVVADKFWFVLALSLFVAAFIYLIFDLWLDFWSDLVPDFGGSRAHTTIALVGWVTIMLTIMSGAFWGEAVTKKLLTPVQFTGRISDPSTKSRKVKYWVVTLVLLPLVVGVFADAIYEIFKLLLAANLG